MTRVNKKHTLSVVLAAATACALLGALQPVAAATASPRTTLFVRKTSIIASVGMLVAALLLLVVSGVLIARIIKHDMDKKKARRDARTLLPLIAMDGRRAVRQTEDVGSIVRMMGSAAPNARHARHARRNVVLKRPRAGFRAMRIVSMPNRIGTVIDLYAYPGLSS